MKKHEIKIKPQLMPYQDDKQALDALRAKIDAIDEAMHNLLIERGSVIDALVAAKADAERPKAAFRPAREAAMMRELAKRHKPPFPLAAAEHIWRHIISTFTHLQMPYRIHVEAGGNAFAMHDAARFYFGFSVELSMEQGPYPIIEAVKSSGRDLGLIALDETSRQRPWWKELEKDQAASIIALLPFIIGGKHGFSTPCCVIAPPLAKEARLERKLIASSISADRQEATKALEQMEAWRLLAYASACSFEDRTEFLLDVPAGAELRQAHERGLMLEAFTQVGMAAAPIVVEESVAS